MKNTTLPHKLWKPFWIACLSYFFRPQYVWFPVHLYTGLLPDSSGQLAENYSTRVDLYSHEILLGDASPNWVIRKSYLGDT